ncbi:gluconate kinase (FGGY family) [Neolewinella xylanilytica]|uniref:Gluconate kinase (FGGY family) n=1 Tax=Neolewinella xylanilytica TaxID=1514080 RepID=A0A2S6I3R8_9BACT|nr:gluconokinase [Neolewinella xylanilytica]PPK85699.1 gluconate kinase (FGGY family) [Neolewinella xylanilytica]
MPTDNIYLGLDLGTTSAKVCAFDAAGKMVDERSGGYELHYPEAGAAVQDPHEIISVAEKLLTELLEALPRTPAGMGISCPMHGVLLLDDQGDPIGPILTWADIRAQAVMDRFPKSLQDELRHRTGTPVHPMSPLVKLRWLADDRPAFLERATYLSDLKSYLVDRWTTAGKVIDEQLASATGLLNLAERDWDDEALRLAGNGQPLNLQLPTVVPARTRLEWRPEVAERLGVADLPLYIGGSDGCLANLGSGLLEPGKVSLTIGTSGAVRVTHRGLNAGVDHQLFNYLLFDDYSVLGGATNNGGKVMEWLYDLLKGHFDSIGDMIASAATAPDTDLRFSPYLNGERAPIWDALATAAFTHLRGNHKARDLARAVLVGVTDNIIEILRQVEAATCPVDIIYASGGFTRSPEWVALLARRSGCTVEIAHTPQASAYGAALVAKRSESVNASG